jgi:hypothetical protein
MDNAARVHAGSWYHLAVALAWSSWIIVSNGWKSQATVKVADLYSGPTLIFATLNPDPMYHDLAGLEYAGESIAEWIGLNDSEYQWAIDEHLRRKRQVCGVCSPVEGWGRAGVHRMVGCLGWRCVFVRVFTLRRKSW